MNLLQVEHLSCGYKGKEIIKDFSFEIEKGELIALLGLNGSGKTTLFKSICGFIPISAGKVLSCGKDLLSLTDKERAKQISYIPQRFSSMEGKTVKEVVIMGFNPFLNLWEQPGKREEIEAVRCLEMVGMDHLKNDYFEEISEGQKQLVIFARALAQNAPVMIMDEPESALDYLNKELVLKTMREVIHREGKAGLLSTHDPNYAKIYCDRMIRLE